MVEEGVEEGCTWRGEAPGIPLPRVRVWREAEDGAKRDAMRGPCEATASAALAAGRLLISVTTRFISKAQVSNHYGRSLSFDDTTQVAWGQRRVGMVSA